MLLVACHGNGVHVVIHLLHAQHIYMLLYCEIYLWYFHTIFSGEIRIDQVYPENESYSCHFPSLELACCFETPPVPSTVWWSIPDEEVINIETDDRVEGHMMDNSMVAFGKSTLKVSNSSVLRGNYTCIVHYENGSQQENKTVPPVEG